MKKFALCLLAATALLTMAAPSSERDLPLAVGKKVTLTCGPKTIAAGLTVSTRLVVNSVCSYRVKGKTKPILVASKVKSITLQASDGQNPCGGQVVVLNQGYFKVPTFGAYSVKVLKVVAAPRKLEKTYKVVPAKFKPVTVVLAPVPGYQAKCGSPQKLPVPPPSVVCPSDPGLGAPCGVPQGPAPCYFTVNTTTRPTGPDGNIVPSGQWVCPSQDPDNFCSTPPMGTFSWFGMIQTRAYFKCSDGTAVEVLLIEVSLTDPSGVSCGPAIVSPVPNISSIVVPKGWGGTIAPVWEINTNGGDAGGELESVPVKLGGTQNGCAAFEASGRPYTN